MRSCWRKCLRDIPEATQRILDVRAPQAQSRRTHPQAIAPHRTTEGADGMARAADPRFDSSDILEERRAVRERVVWLCTRLGETGSVTSDDTVPCSLPVATEPASVYRGYTPPPALKEFLICTWTLETLARGQPHQQRVLPDGCSDIVWFGHAQPVVVGPMTRPVLATTDAGAKLVGLRFRPEVASRVLGVPAHELTDRDVPLDDLWNPGAIDRASDRIRERAHGCKAALRSRSR